MTNDSTNLAAEIADRYGMVDGAHHKQWVIDQMLRVLLGADGYLDWRKRVDAERLDSGLNLWDVGVAP